MTAKKGIVALMGSGELTSTMVEVHKELLSRVGENPVACFLDTPAGFQLNADQISERAVQYFRTRVRHPMTVASFKSENTLAPMETESTFQSLRRAEYVLIGPGSPTYAVRHLQNTPVVEILKRNIEKGGCLVAASAAALTVGARTLPVYEIYKVGEPVHWVDGLNILSGFGLRIVVIPHWNNAEGGTHDTRYCFMGKKRFEKLETLLPEEESILGIDEHTACIIDFGKQKVDIRGAGRVVLKRRESETVFEKGDSVRLGVFTGRESGGAFSTLKKTSASEDNVDKAETSEEAESFWDRIHALEEIFQENLTSRDFQRASSQLLELDRLIWKAKEDLENEEFISQAREILREFIVLLGTEADLLPKSRADCLAELVEEFVGLRSRFRDDKKWEEADLIRDSLLKADIVVEDAPGGPRWRDAESVSEKSTVRKRVDH